MTALALQAVDLIHNDGSLISGLVAVRQSPTKAGLSIDEHGAMLDAANFKHIDFVFFRRFCDGRSSQIAAYVIDNSDDHLSTNELAKLHWQLWLHGAAPLIYIAGESQIDVLSCARGPDFWDQEGYQYNPAASISTETIAIAHTIDAELQKRFSAFRLVDGTFWENPKNAKLAEHDKAAHRALISTVVETDKEIGGPQSPVMRRLLLLMILIKYLEDRRVFPNGWFGKYENGAKSFFDVLRTGNPDNVKRLLSALERRFNGDIFALPISGKDKLTRKNLKSFANLVEAKTLREQQYLWAQFSFEHLPVEIISHLYQRFVEGGHGTVYTPPFLASLILDHALPYEALTGKERILDPACGSGVFLVGAFRRLVNAWRAKNRWRRPDVAILKQILRQSIFGVELDPNAVNLTAFSLALAVCDVLKPEVIWRELMFDPFRDKNLFEADFFQLILDKRSGKKNLLDDGFDIVVGNPPFESKLTDAGNELDKKLKSKSKDRGTTPDKQSAYLFLEQSLESLSEGGHVCLIQPASFLYNRKVAKFRRYVFGRCSAQSILDLTSIRNLFVADAKAVVVHFSANTPSDGHLIGHWTFRRTASVHERICFELDHYDRHRMMQSDAESDAFVWRANLLGGGRLYSMSRRLREMRTLAEYVGEQGWDYGEGFIVGSGKTEVDFLPGKPFLPTGALNYSGIDSDKIGVVEDEFFESPRNELRYLPPLFLIKEHSSLPVAYWDNGPLAYRDNIVGIHANPSDASDLKRLFEFIVKHKADCRLSCALNGSKLFVSKATAILKQDIDMLPYPINPQEIEFSFWEEALRDDVLQYMADYIRLGQNSKLLKKAATSDDLQRYANMFCKMLGSIYTNLKATEPIVLNGLICQPFFFGEKPDLRWLVDGSEKELNDLVYLQENESLRTIRMLRFYDKNVILLVKPDRLRYWIRSTAIWDADETLIDLRNQGY